MLTITVDCVRGSCAVKLVKLLVQQVDRSYALGGVVRIGLGNISLIVALF
jgi:hypothetical protein